MSACYRGLSLTVLVSTGSTVADLFAAVGDIKGEAAGLNGIGNVQPPLEVPH